MSPSGVVGSMPPRTRRAPPWGGDGSGQRRLAAVLAADVVGYSRLLSTDESGTLERVAQTRAMMARIIAERGGRVVHQAGDAFLAELGSVIDAVQSAIDMQEALHAPADRDPARLQYRIGVHFGDVVDMEGDIHGDGVNLAARLQAAADPGAIAISGAVHDAVRRKINARFDFLGELQFKNIDGPVRVYIRRLGQADGPPPLDTATGALNRLRSSTHPVIRIEEFRSLSGGRTTSLLSEGLAEELFTLLSCIPSFTVVRAQEAGLAQDVPADHRVYLLNGAVRGGRGTARITAHLQDARSSANLWSGRYDLNGRDRLRVQEQIAKDVATDIQVTLTEGEHARLWASTTDNWRAWLLFQIGHHKEHLSTREGKIEARRHYEQALQLDANYVPAIVALGFCHTDAVRFGWSRDREESLRVATGLHGRAAAIRDDYPETHALAAYIAVLSGDRRAAQAAIQNAVDLAPGSAKMMAYMGGISFYLGDLRGAITCFESAMAFTPHYAVWIATNLGMAYRLAGRLSDAVAIFEQALQRDPRNPRALIGLTGLYARLGQMEQARSRAAELLRVDPFFTVESWAANLPYPEPTTIAELMSDLRRAGVP